MTERIDERKAEHFHSNSNKLAVQATYVHLGQRLYLNPGDVSHSLRGPADGPPAGAAAAWDKQVGAQPAAQSVRILAPTKQLLAFVTTVVKNCNA